MKKLYCVRHGESEENLKKIYMGAHAELTELGQKQARAVAERAEKLAPERLFSSRYVRAQKTALAISERLNLPLETLDFAHEYNYRKKEQIGKHASEPDMLKTHKLVKEAWLTGKPTPEYAESFEDVLSRVNKFVEFINSLKEERVLFVGHSFFLKLLAAKVLAGEHLNSALAYGMREALFLSNTGVTLYEIDEDLNWQLKIWNDDAHL